MTDRTDRSPSRNASPWIIAALAATTAAAVVGGIGWASHHEDEAPAVSAAQRPGPQVAHVSESDIASCNQLAAEAERKPARVLQDSLIGGAVGAGVGAAGGAIAAGGDGAGKGAGVGALVGATAGTLVGLDRETRRSEAAREAYRACMARRGY